MELLTAHHASCPPPPRVCLSLKGDVSRGGGEVVACGSGGEDGSGSWSQREVGWLRLHLKKDITVLLLAERRHLLAGRSSRRKQNKAKACSGGLEPRGVGVREEKIIRHFT